MQALYPCFFASVKPRKCLLPLAVGASGKMATPFTTRVQDFTSNQHDWWGDSRRKSNLFLPKKVSCLIRGYDWNSLNCLFRNASATSLFGIRESIETHRLPRRTAMTSCVVFLV